MERIFVVAVALLIPLAAAAQPLKTPVSLGHTGKDQVGSLFVEAFSRQLSRSPRYESMSESEKGFRFFVDFITVDAADMTPEKGKRSAVSVVIEQMGLPNSFPVADMWYHKIIVVDRRTVDATAKELLEDMTARWCSYLKDSVGGCAKKRFEPKLSPN